MASDEAGAGKASPAREDTAPADRYRDAHAQGAAGQAICSLEGRFVESKPAPLSPNQQWIWVRPPKPPTSGD